MLPQKYNSSEQGGQVFQPTALENGRLIIQTKCIMRFSFIRVSRVYSNIQISGMSGKICDVTFDSIRKEYPITLLSISLHHMFTCWCGMFSGGVMAPYSYILSVAITSGGLIDENGKKSVS